MNNTKLIFIAVLAIAALFLILQNRVPVVVTLFFFKVEMPLIIMLLVNTGIGFLLGLLLTMTGKPKLKK